MRARSRDLILDFRHRIRMIQGQFVRPRRFRLAALPLAGRGCTAGISELLHPLLLPSGRPRRTRQLCRFRWLRLRCRLQGSGSLWWADRLVCRTCGVAIQRTRSRWCRLWCPFGTKPSNNGQGAGLWRGWCGRSSAGAPHGWRPGSGMPYYVFGDSWSRALGAVGRGKRLILLRRRRRRTALPLGL